MTSLLHCFWDHNAGDGLTDLGFRLSSVGGSSGGHLRGGHLRWGHLRDHLRAHHVEARIHGHIRCMDVDRLSRMTDRLTEEAAGRKYCGYGRTHVRSGWSSWKFLKLKL